MGRITKTNEGLHIGKTEKEIKKDNAKKSNASTKDKLDYIIELLEGEKNA